MDAKSSTTPKGMKQNKPMCQNNRNNNNNSPVATTPATISRSGNGHRNQASVKPKSPSGQRPQSFQPFASLVQHTRSQQSSPKPINQNRNHNHTTPARYSPTSYHQHSTSPMSTSSRSSPTNSHRSSPTRSTISPSRSSPNNFASSTCYQPPTPSSLPKPPLKWTVSQTTPPPYVVSEDPTAHLKLLLNVQA